MVVLTTLSLEMTTLRTGVDMMNVGDDDGTDWT